MEDFITSPTADTKRRMLGDTVAAGEVVANEDDLQMNVKGSLANSRQIAAMQVYKEDPDARNALKRSLAQ